MENIEKIILGLIVFTITSVIAYLFKMSQLYAVTPKLYRHAPVSNKGTICELIIFNKGNQPEESIQVALDPDLKIELLASSSSDLSLEGVTLKLDRLHKGCEASAILLIENGHFDSNKILSVSSKAEKGKIHKKITDVPPNYAKTFVLFAFMIGIIPAFLYGLKAYDFLNKKHIEEKMQRHISNGWSSLYTYYDSELRKSYSDQEFPIRFLHKKTDPDQINQLTFEVYNKTALPMTVYIKHIGGDDIYSGGFASVEVAPISKEEITIKEPPYSKQFPKPMLNFSIKAVDDYLYDIVYKHQDKKN